MQIQPAVPPLSREESLPGRGSVLGRNGRFNKPRNIAQILTLLPTCRIFSVNAGTDPLSLSIAACQLLNAQSTSRWINRAPFLDSPSPNAGGQVASFLSMFRDSWGRLEHRHFVQKPTSSEACKPQDVIFHYHMRLLSAS